MPEAIPRDPEKGSPVESFPFLSEEQKGWFRDHTSETVQKLAAGAYGLARAWVFLKFGPPILSQIKSIVGGLIPNLSMGGSSPDLGSLGSLAQSVPELAPLIALGQSYLGRLGSTSITSPIETIALGTIGAIGTVIIAREVWKSIRPTLPYAVAGGAEAIKSAANFIDAKIQEHRQTGTKPTPKE